MATTTQTETSNVITMTTAVPAKTELKVVYGAMALGKKEGQARVTDLKDCAAILDVFQKHGHVELDTARVYGFGSSEAYLSQLEWQKRGLVVNTKLKACKLGPKLYTHKKDGLKSGLLDSLQALGADKVDTFYLHMPDYNTPIEETLESANELYEAGYFRRFGLSNFPAWEVAQICELCARNGWKTPDVYQGVYHALHRGAEPELFKCLRHYGIAFYMFSPVAGGMLTDKYQRDTTELETDGSRFDPKKFQGVKFREWYWNDAYFDALDIIRPVAKKHGITTAEAAVRWASHHSALKKEYGDAIITGASSAAQLEENLTNLEKGPLPEELVKAFDAGWEVTKRVAGPYFLVG